MLVLPRKTGEAIVLDHDTLERKIVVCVVTIRNDRVRLGIDAPSTWSVMRRELVRDPATNSIGRLYEPAPQLQQGGESLLEMFARLKQLISSIEAKCQENEL